MLSVDLVKYFRHHPILVVILFSTFYNCCILTYLISTKYPFYGSSSYGTIAKNLIQYRKYSLDGQHSTFYRPPIYPLFLTVARGLGKTYWIATARFMQGGVSILCSVLIFLIAQHVTHSKAVGYWATIFYHCHVLLQAEHYAQRETLLFECFALLYVYNIVKNYGQLNLRHIIQNAILAALLFLTRPTGFIFFGMTIGMLIWEGTRKKRFGYVLLFLLLFAIFCAPWQYYHYTAFGTLSLSSSNTSGINLYKGTSPVIQTIYPSVDLDLASTYIHQQLKQQGIDQRSQENEANRYLLREAKAYIISHPVFFLKRMIVKLFALYSPLPTPLGRGEVHVHDNQLMITNFRFPGTFIDIPTVFITTILLSFGGFELVRFHDPFRNRAQRFKLLIGVIFLGLTILHVISFAETRFRLPFDGLLCILTGMFFSRKYVTTIT